MTEFEIVQTIADNRIIYLGWLQTYWGVTLAVFFLAYVIRNTPVYVRATVFVMFFIGTLNLVVVGAMGNQGMAQLLQDLASISAETNFSQGMLVRLNATPTEAVSVPIWVQLVPLLIYVLNIAIGFYLLLLAKRNLSSQMRQC